MQIIAYNFMQLTTPFVYNKVLYGPKFKCVGILETNIVENRVMFVDILCSNVYVSVRKSTFFSIMLDMRWIENMSSLQIPSLFILFAIDMHTLTDWVVKKLNDCMQTSYKSGNNVIFHFNFFPVWFVMIF